jgi:hypothetical protein
MLSVLAQLLHEHLADVGTCLVYFNDEAAGPCSSSLIAAAQDRLTGNDGANSWQAMGHLENPKYRTVTHTRSARMRVVLLATKAEQA